MPGGEIDHVPTEHARDVGMLLEVLDLTLDLRRQPTVVGVEEGDQPTGGSRDPGITCRTRPRVRAAEHPNSVEPLRDLGGVIGGAVVDDEQLVDRAGLGLDAVETIREVRGAVEHRDDGADHRAMRVGCSVNGHAPIARYVPG